MRPPRSEFFRKGRGVLTVGAGNAGTSLLRDMQRHRRQLHLTPMGLIDDDPMRGHVAAVSVGVVDGRACLDLHYDDDVRAGTDMNVVMNDGGAYIELQGTAEGHAFRRDELDAMLNLAETGIAELIRAQREALDG